MNKYQRQSLKVRLLKLTELKSTGAPMELARKLEVSERSVKRFIKEIRDEGYDIRYSPSRRSYISGKDYM